jgi:hypothetical protein
MSASYSVLYCHKRTPQVGEFIINTALETAKFKMEGLDLVRAFLLVIRGRKHHMMTESGKGLKSSFIKNSLQ